MQETAPALVTLHLWGVRTRQVPAALVRMALDRPRLRGIPGLGFAKLLGTGAGRTFTVTDADPHHWGLIAAWRSTDAAAMFDTHAVAAGWDRLAAERLRVAMRPLASRGRWSGRSPFEPGGDTPLGRWDGPVGAVTRARIAPRRWSRFWRAVPPVAVDLHRCPGLLLAVAVGEAPIGLQGTFSMWDSAAALQDFAYRGARHAEVIRRTTSERWYAEELFARFAVVDVDGTYDGRTLPWNRSR